MLSVVITIRGRTIREVSARGTSRGAKDRQIVMKKTLPNSKAKTASANSGEDHFGGLHRVGQGEARDAAQPQAVLADDIATAPEADARSPEAARPQARRALFGLHCPIAKVGFGSKRREHCS